MATQKILFLRNGNPFSNYAAAVAALATLTHEAGKPVVAIYNDEDALKLIFAIGTAEGKYHVVSKDSEIDNLNSLFAEYLESFEAHVETAAGSDLGHAKTGGDLTFTNGVGTVNDSAITYNKLQNTNNQGAGVVLGSTAVEGEVVELGPNEILSILSSATNYSNIENKNNFSKINVGDESIVADSQEAEFGIEAGDNVAVEINGSNVKISVDPTNFEVAKAGEAGKLSQDLTIELGSHASGSATFNGSEGSVTLDVTISEDGKAAIFADAALTGTPTAPTAAAGTDTQQIATTAFVKTAVANALDGLIVENALEFKGIATAASDVPAEGEIGDIYLAGEAYESIAGKLEAGDMLVYTEAGWNVIQKNIDGAVTSVETVSEAGDIVVFNAADGKVVKNSGIKAADVVQKGRKVSAGSGLTGGGDLSGDITISHATKAEGVVNNGKGFTTDITVDEYGHIVSSTKAAISITEGEDAGTSTTTFISGITPNEDGLGFTITKQTVPAETGKVKVNDGDTADFLKNQIIEGTADEANNIYAVQVNQVADNDPLNLTVKIDVIDGGTY